MCGFTGFIDFNNSNLNYDKILNECSNDIAFRGPDDNKIYSDRGKGIFLSFRRLSFLDLTDNSSQNDVKNELNYLGIGHTNFKVVIIQQIPLNSNGKIDYKKLTEIL